MIFNKDKLYKLVEFSSGLIIMDSEDNLERKDQVPLIIAGAGHMVTYLDRYFYERERGVPGPDAHKRALQTANMDITLEAPGKVNGSKKP